MEFLEGKTLFERLQEGPLTNEELVKYSIQIVDALDKAHKQGLVHRDLKPSNVMLTKEGATSSWILDWLNYKGQSRA